jgi:hypothetical protein
MAGFSWDDSDTGGAAEAAGSAAILGFPGAASQAGGVASGTGTGQHGVVPVASNGNGTIAGYFASLNAWLKAPFMGVVSPQGIFLLIGAIAISLILWNLILYHIRIASEAI